jgi:hypothetical protein
MTDEQDATNALRHFGEHPDQNPELSTGVTLLLAPYFLVAYPAKTLVSKLRGTDRRP